MPSIHGFRSLTYPDISSHPLHLILTIGHESTQDPCYRFDGQERTKGLLFQYTLSGEGKLSIGQNTFSVPKNHGFFVHIPSDHYYYFDPSSADNWEFIWIKLYATEVSKLYWNHFIDRFGHVAFVPSSAEPILILWSLYNSIANKKIEHQKHDISFRVYEWILSLLRFSEGEVRTDRHLPETVQIGKQFMEQHFHESISLSQIAEAAKVSPNHFCKMFQKHVGASPVEYLRLVRLEKAAHLLKHTRIPVSQIAVETGFDNLSYFGKVFRKLIGMTPSEYRDGKSDLAGNQLHIMS